MTLLKPDTWAAATGTNVMGKALKKLLNDPENMDDVVCADSIKVYIREMRETGNATKDRKWRIGEINERKSN